MKNGKGNMQLAIPPGADAALCFIAGQYFLQYANESGQKGKFLSPASVRSAFRGEPIDTGWLPEGVNRWGICSRGTWMLRFHAPMIYRIHLADSKRPLRAPMPSLIWFGIGNAYYIWAIEESKLSPKATLYHAPLANVNNLGLVCFGSDNDHPNAGKGGFDPSWRTFWKAPFNDHHDNGKSLSLKENESINKLLRELHREKAERYPLHDLVSMRTTVEQMVERLTKRKGDNLVFDDDEDDFPDEDEDE